MTEQREQLDLFAARSPASPASSRTAKERDYAAEWQALLVRVPWLGPEILRMAYERLAQGDRYIGVKALFELLRPRMPVGRSGKPSLDNNLSAPAGRWLVTQCPALGGVVQMRPRRHA